MAKQILLQFVWTWLPQIARLPGLLENTYVLEYDEIQTKFTMKRYVTHKVWMLIVIVYILISLFVFLDVDRLFIWFCKGDAQVSPYGLLGISYIRCALYIYCLKNVK